MKTIIENETMSSTVLENVNPVSAEFQEDDSSEDIIKFPNPVGEVIINDLSAECENKTITIEVVVDNVINGDYKFSYSFPMIHFYFEMDYIMDLFKDETYNEKSEFEDYIFYLMNIEFHCDKTDNQKIRLALDALLYVALNELFTEPFKLKTDHSLEYLVYFNFNGNYPIAKVFPKN